jgi:hypothetical protein
MLPGFFDSFAHALDCGDGDCEHEPEVAGLPVLRLARYASSRYLKHGHAEFYELQLAGLLRSGLLMTCAPEIGPASLQGFATDQGARGCLARSTAPRVDRCQGCRSHPRRAPAEAAHRGR